ncbi:hypothetical protein ABZ897_25120 [Nonomuraea sp. NPDC046802]|uniref:hypothetical protein n=1 Tax=Nonomuraea sp. NPDC046802 TaxID=3154919 RepID=UPI0033F1A9AF
MLIAVGVVVVLFVGAVAVGASALLPGGKGTATTTTAADADDDESGSDAPPSPKAKAEAEVDLTAFNGEHICSALAPETLKKLVPEAEENPDNGVFGPMKAAECEWESGDQSDQRVERYRTLKVDLTSFIRPDADAEWKFNQERKKAEVLSGKTSGFVFDQMRDVPGIGEAAFGNTFGSEAGRYASGAEIVVRVAGGVVIVNYLGWNREGGALGKRSTVSTDMMMNGAKTVAKEIVAALKKKPAEARTIDRLTGDIRGQDVCKVVAQESVDKIVPNHSVSARNSSSSDRLYGKSRLASCDWESRPSRDQGATYVFSRLTVEVTTVERRPGDAFAGEKKAAQGQARRSDDQVREGPVKNLSGLGEAAFSQVREVKMGEQHSRAAQVWFLTGNRIVHVSYDGSRAPNRPGAGISTTPLAESAVYAAAETIAKGLPSRIGGN